MVSWLAALLLFSCGRCAEPPPLQDLGPFQRDSTIGADFFGINEAVSIPQAWIRQGHIQESEEAAELQADARLALDLGVSIVRANSPVYPYLDHYSLLGREWDWRQSDLWVKTVQEAGLEALMVIGPWPGNRTAAYTPHYLPDDLDAYAEYVRRVVERYDGDGQDDMPGLTRPIRYWEVDNEPDLHHTAPAKGVPNPPDPSTFETPAEYAQILKLSSQIIRATHPNPTILSGGLFRPHAQNGRQYLEDLLAISGVKESFDVLSLHCYFDANHLDIPERTMRLAAELMPGTPVWITETGVPSIGRGPHIDSAWQAKMVVSVYGSLSHGGRSGILAYVDPPNPSRHIKRAPFASHSLLQASDDNPPGPGGTRTDKPAGIAYRNLASVMAQVDPQSLQEIEATGGRILQTDRGLLIFWGSPTLPSGFTNGVSLLTGEPTTSSDSPAWFPNPTTEEP